MYLLDRQFGEKIRSFRAEGGSGFGEMAIGEITINDESNLDRSYFSFANVFSSSWFGLLPHCHFIKQRSKKEEEKWLKIFLGGNCSDFVRVVNKEGNSTGNVKTL